MSLFFRAWLGSQQLSLIIALSILYSQNKHVIDSPFALQRNARDRNDTAGLISKKDREICRIWQEIIITGGVIEIIGNGGPGFILTGIAR